MRKIYIVRTKSTHYITYAIASDTDLKEQISEVSDKINKYGLADLTQEWYGEEIDFIMPGKTEEEYIEWHDQKFPQAADIDNEHKLLVINYEKLTDDEVVMIEDKDLI